MRPLSRVPPRATLPKNPLHRRSRLTSRSILITCSPLTLALWANCFSPNPTLLKMTSQDRLNKHGRRTTVPIYDAPSTMDNLDSVGPASNEYASTRGRWVDRVTTTYPLDVEHKENNLSPLIQDKCNNNFTRWNVIHQAKTCLLTVKLISFNPPPLVHNTRRMEYMISSNFKAT